MPNSLNNTTMSSVGSQKGDSKSKERLRLEAKAIFWVYVFWFVCINSVQFIKNNPQLLFISTLTVMVLTIVVLILAVFDCWRGRWIRGTAMTMMTAIALSDIAVMWVITKSARQQ